MKNLTKAILVTTMLCVFASASAMAAKK